MVQPTPQPQFEIPAPQEETPAPAVVSEPAQKPVNKRLKFTVLVSEKQSGEFLKTVQDNEAYEMDNLELIK